MPTDILSADLYGQPLPFNLEAEQSVLGALILDSECITEVMELLRSEYFHDTRHQEIYSVMVRMFTMGEAIDPITVLENVRKEKIFETPDEAKVYLARLADVVPSTFQDKVRDYAAIVQEQY